MHRIILFLVLIALAAAGAAWIADQTGDVALSWGVWRVHTSLPVFVLALGVVIVAACSPGRSCAGSGARPSGCAARGASGATRAAATPSPTACSRSATAIPRRPRACRRGATPCIRRSAGAAAACAIGATRGRPRRRAARFPRHGRTQGYQAARLARVVHRGAARRRFPCGDRDRRRGAENCRRDRPGHRRPCWDFAAPRATGPARWRSSTTISPPARSTRRRIGGSAACC